MFEYLKFLPCLFLFLFASCSPNVAGSTEEPNAVTAQDSDVADTVTIVPDSGLPIVEVVSSSSIVPQENSSSSEMTIAPIGGSSSSATSIPSSSAATNVMQSRFWSPYWYNEADSNMTNLKIETDEDDDISVSYEVSMSLGGSAGYGVSRFGIEIRVDGEGPDVFSEMKTWTGGACYMVTSEVPITLKMGMSPEKEKELKYDLPQATLIGPNDVGNLVIRCLSWLDFEQQGFGPAITIEEAFFDYMTSLRFEVPNDDFKYYKGSFEIHQIRAGGTGISANMDGMDITVDDGTEYVEQPDAN